MKNQQHGHLHEEVVDMKISANGDVQTETANTAEGKVDILNAMKNLDF